MTTKQLSRTELNSFITSLDIGKVRHTLDAEPLKTASGKSQAGYVDKGSVVSFVAGVSPQHQNDVLNSCLLAQLAASKKYDPEKQTEQWYDFYKTVLANVGWTMQAFSFEKFNASGDTFEIDAVVIELLAAVATGSELVAIKASLDALKSLAKNDNRIVLFEQNSHSASAGNFQISSANEAGGQVAMSMGALYMSSKQTVVRILWDTFASSNTNLYKGSQTMTLNEDVYGQVRGQIVEKLGDNAHTFIGNLDI